MWNDGDTKHAWDLAVSRLAAGIVCIFMVSDFVRWTDMPGPASAFYRLLIPRW